ncbi:MAG: hypothetical protein PQ612_00765 [Rickettsiales bacterium]|nr:hypothetical protein [Pseudomonadota bacterium]MDA0965554.1 hypothetical protein [Pseudomonadota bacterium]MDG4542878.1 hypothetical protein [Rickettsiales bacterium]MDG4544674.1 hypothetical protein [Rickettsiales bacterium]MDG4546796.1 hypothetical protein [Rickettsiales bacterium]
MKDLFGKIFNKQQNIDDLSVEAQYTNADYADISTIVNDANADNISTMANTSQNGTTEERKRRVKSAPLYIPGMLDDESLISETSKISLPDEIKPDSEALLKIHQQQMEFREREQQRKDNKVEQTGRSGV